MVTYILYGFRWQRAPNSQAPGIRAYIALYNLLDAAAEYLQHPTTTAAVLNSFKLLDPNILTLLPNLQLIEQYDPEDLSPDAVSQPYAYVAAKIMAMGAKALSGAGLGLGVQEILQQDPGLSTAGREVFKKLRDELAPDSEIGWFIVYNGDPERSSEGSDGGSPVDDGEDYAMGSRGSEAATAYPIGSTVWSYSSSYDVKLHKVARQARENIWETDDNFFCRLRIFRNPEK
ncbi:hypothetical protein GX51_01910 [Blastomyces parvus]|uniref:Uncharacterized protein n=1 Tax=Blastomyces parvus TaxID=2060905 RepID=A0A2B7XEE9_9EURO|nr:hypothetical protein GX51_01910 [Blastomyces parvus]